MTIQSTALSVVGKLAVQQAVKMALYEHLPKDQAQRYLELAGIETPDLRPQLDMISQQIATLTDLAKDIQKDMVFLQFGDRQSRLRAQVKGYIDVYKRYRDFVRANAAAIDNGTLDEFLTVQLNELDARYQAQCAGVLENNQGLARLVREFVEAAGQTLPVHGLRLFEVFARVLRRDATDVFSFSDKMNQIFNTFLFDVVEAVMVINEARCHYRNERKNAIDLIDLEYTPLHDVHAHYLKTTSGEHQAAFRLRELGACKAKVLIRRSSSNPRDNLFLAAFGFGQPLSTESAVKTGLSHGEIRIAYDVGAFENTKSGSMPQLLTPKIGLGRKHAITVKDRPLWSVPLEATAQTVGSLVGGMVGAAAADAVAWVASPKSSSDTFVHDTASQLWELGVLCDQVSGQSVLTLKNVQSGLYLAPKQETWRTALSGDGQAVEVRWLPILCEGEANLPGLHREDRMHFKLRSVLHDKLLNSASDLSVVCNERADSASERVRWQFLTETPLPVDTVVQPGCYMSSTNQEYQMIYHPQGGISIYGKSSGRVCSLIMPVVGNVEGQMGALILWPDGNLAQYDASGQAMRASNTRVPLSAGVLTNDGDFKIVAPDGKVLYSARGA